MNNPFRYRLSDGREVETQARRVLEVQADAIVEHLATGGRDATLPGLGKLKLSARITRTGRNPQTGEPVQIPARVVVKFAPAKALTDAINP
ncbi:HU family DNA-binding protein [Pseudothauera rhizosphaerae]|uniref:HU family DNA-binding protein n=1 Tax=Pseudothauera rhizosphaerae TaxID=2565932 RepID=A0A4S4AMS9_9RHOO|nr:HU family DNA-binding protein [Pseudothauera rhizosphaerae]THF60933.1 HU family DNA-binding protein [Pseudothauera rhizosphaerae]